MSQAESGQRATAATPAGGSSAPAVPAEVLDKLNRECFCVTLDAQALRRAAQREVEEAGFVEQQLDTRPFLFSQSPVFLPQADLARMLDTVRAIEAAAALPAYRDAALARAADIARHDFGPRGAFMGYDFHLTQQGPRLIEINTNAGGAFLNVLLARAQRACCAEVEQALSSGAADDFDEAVVRMFRREWALQRGGAPLQRIAIVDDDPQQQFLYPEFRLAQRLLTRAGIEALVVDARALRYERGVLLAEGRPVDLVYNRLVDFALQQAEHDALRQAYVDGATVVTPNPHVYALLADKRNMILLSHPQGDMVEGLSAEQRLALARIPETQALTPDNAQDLWARRKLYFFKPASGYGSKAVYRGDKITKSVWAGLVGQDYVAQALVAPSERNIRVEGQVELRKVDVRLYVYDGNLLFAAARLYQGQTTNFRTPGGGFAPLFAL